LSATKLGSIAIKGESLVLPHGFLVANQLRSPAAVERVPQIKPQDVEEVFFGNVLSAKYVLFP